MTGVDGGADDSPAEEDGAAVEGAGAAAADAEVLSGWMEDIESFG